VPEDWKRTIANSSWTGKNLLDQNDILTGRLVRFIAERSATVSTKILVFVSLGQDEEEAFSDRNSLFALGAIESCCLELIKTTFWCERTGGKIHEFNSLKFSRSSFFYAISPLQQGQLLLLPVQLLLLPVLRLLSRLAE
jgi:hypothetical protein